MCGLLCFFSLAAALLNLSLWALGRDRLTRRLGLLCTAYALRMSYPFLRTLGVPAIRSLYAAEDFCAAAVLLCAILLAGELSGAGASRLPAPGRGPGRGGDVRGMRDFSGFYPTTCAAAYQYLWFAALCMENISGRLSHLPLCPGAAGAGALGRYLLCSAGLYGFSLAVSALTAGYLEPEFGAWPEEYGTFALVAGFAALMVHRGVLLVRENRRLNEHLSEEVARKTRALETLLGERRELLATLVHDIKNPLSAVRSYADLVRSSSVELDAETAACLNALSERVGAVEDRFGLLQDFSRAERAAGKEKLALSAFLRGFYESNRAGTSSSAGQRFGAGSSRGRSCTSPPGRLSCARRWRISATTRSPSRLRAGASLSRCGARAAARSYAWQTRAAASRPRTCPTSSSAASPAAPTAAARASAFTSSAPSPSNTAAAPKPSPSPAKAAPSNCTCPWREIGQ